MILHDVPETWQPADSVVWGKLMALQLSHNYRMEMLRAELRSEFSATQLGWLFPMPPAGTPVTTQPVTLPMPEADHANLPAQEQLATLLGLDHAASNEWVIGGSLTASGKPILANDPHLGLEAPILWYLARIVTPQGSVKGATVPGLPIVVLGQTDHLAWGFTTTGSDTQDLFIETVDPANPKNYLTPSGSEPFITRDEVIRIKGRADAHVTLRATRHGPVLSDIDGEMMQLAGDGKVMALAFTGLGSQDTTAEALLKINHAQSAVDLFEALKLYQTPAQNIVYADSDGAFGFINPGLVPVRKKGDGLMPVEGSSGDYDWGDFIPLDKLPQIADPLAGYVFNTNNSVVAQDPALYFGQDWEESFRARRLQQLFNETQGKFTVARSAQMQADHLSLAAQDLLPVLLEITPTNDRAKQALAMLRGWNGVMDKDRAEPVIFDAWLYKFHRHMLPLKTNVNMNEKGPFAAEALLSLVKNHAADWCALQETPGAPALPPDPDCHRLMAQSLDEALAMETQSQGPDMKKWRWGFENVAALRHKFYSHVPLLKDWSDLSIESSGDFYTIDRGGSFNADPHHPLERTHGGGFRGIYDLANPDASLFAIATGESGHIFSKHYGDQVKLWNDAKAITLEGSEDQLKQRGLPMLELVP
jgi:penicillin amidase